MRKSWKCEKCQIVFRPSNNWQRFCGSIRDKAGCSIEEYRRRHRIKNLRYRLKKKQYIKDLEKKVATLLKVTKK